MIDVIVMFKSFILKKGEFEFFQFIGEHWFTSRFSCASWSIQYDGKNSIVKWCSKIHRLLITG